MGRTTVTSKALTLFAPNDRIPEFAHPNDTVGTPKLRPFTNGHHHGHNRARAPPGPTLGETPVAPRSPRHTPYTPNPNPSYTLGTHGSLPG